MYLLASVGKAASARQILLTCWPKANQTSGAWSSFLSRDWRGDEVARDGKSITSPACGIEHKTTPSSCARRRYSVPASRPTVPTLLRQDPSLDTIYALSTSPSLSIPSALAIIRVSGPLSSNVFRALTGDAKLPSARLATIRKLRDPKNAEDILDPEALILRFPGPKSVTGEDVLELHVHGGIAVIDGVLQAINHCMPTSNGNQRGKNGGGNIRYAEPGEFTRRAVLNGRLDLSSAEALGDVLTAKTSEQRRNAAKRTSEGRQLSEVYEKWRLWLNSARGVLEGIIDFSEDQQFEDSAAKLLSDITQQVIALSDSLAVHIKNAERGEVLRNGIAVALIGRPNAGKSSLLNLLVGREAAIVSEERGTTRDLLEVNVDLQGWLCRFVDTAGLRVAGQEVGKVEQEGIRRAKQRALESDVVILLISPDKDTALSSHNQITISIDKETLETAQQCVQNGAHLIVAINKTDLLSSSSSPPDIQIANLSMLKSPSTDEETKQQKATPVVQISCKLASNAQDPKQIAASGIQNLLEALVTTFRNMTSAIVRLPGEGGRARSARPGAIFAGDGNMAAAAQLALGSSERQRQLLVQCAGHLDAFLGMASSATPQLGSSTVAPGEGGDGELDDEVDFVLAAESLRAAADCLGRITGQGEGGDVEEVLGVVFEKFCVGK